MRPLLALLVLGAVAGCGSDHARVAFGAPCAACSMTITDARFACVRRDGGRWKSFDSIECLLRDGRPAAADVRLADYDTRRLVPADSLWILHGDFPSPMGGGLAAFASRPAADDVAREVRGVVRRYTDLPGDAAR